MKIIQNNYKEQNLEQFVCEHCNSIFEYDENDIKFNLDGDKIVRCPCCNLMCLVDYPKTNENNISFPKSFYQFGVHDGAINIDNEKITSRIKEAIVWLKRHPEEPYKYVGSGDTFLCVFNHEDEYYIMVAKNYFDTSIDK